MEGEATITLDGKDHQVVKGNGIYLGDREGANRSSRVCAASHLVVPKQS
jgi:hypothetical protein